MAKKQQVLGTMAMAMITVAAIVSLRNLPINAVLGFSAVSFLVVAAIVFFIPISLVTAELASGWPRPGGNYVWVSEAFGKPWGFFALWMSWMESIAWFPAILAFTAAMFFHFIEPIVPGLADNTICILVLMLVVFWGATITNFFGIELSSWVSSLGVLLGTLVPGALIIGLGTLWLIQDMPTQIEFTLDALIPSFDLDNLVIFSGVILGLAGIELSAFHIRDAKDPQRNYPKAVAIGCVIILFVYILGTVAIAAVVPKETLSLSSGLVQAFQVFFLSFGWAWVVPVLALFLFIGSLASINTWTVGPAKGMLVTAEDHFLPETLKEVNKNDVPVALLILQAVIGSVLAMVFLYLDDSSAAMWVLIALSAQFTCAQYILVFLAVLKLRKSQPKVKRGFVTPLVWPISIIGILACLFGFFIVFIPPAQLNTGDSTIYRMMLLVSFAVLSVPPLIFNKNRLNYLEK